MANQRVDGTSLSNSSPYSNFHGIHHNPSAVFMNQEGAAFDFGELEEAIVLQGVKLGNDESKSPHFKPAATLEMFPSWPIRFQQTPTLGGGSKSESTDSGSANINNTFTSKTELEMEPESPISIRACSSAQGFDQIQPLLLHQNQSPAKEKRESLIPLISHYKFTKNSSHSLEKKKNHSTMEENNEFCFNFQVGNTQSQEQFHNLPSISPTNSRKGAGSTSEKQLDAKTLRRLAQNREAARKSRLRKKAYIQQLESSRIKLSQLEQDLHTARSQGLILGACGGVMGSNISSGAAIFDMEYARWLDEDHRVMVELRAAVQGHLPDGDLRAIVDSYICHYDEIFHLKSVAAKSDVFHLITGMWMTPAERCFLWIGGFRPSKLIEMLIPQLETLTEQQAVGICNLQRSSQETEDALFQGLEQLQHSLIYIIAGTALVDGINQMAEAAGKLSNLEGFIRQADMLRQQTLHQLRRILTVRQAAQCFVVIGEYYGRLRALSSLWVSRPRESCLNDENSCQTTTELQMIQSSNPHFPNF